MILIRINRILLERLVAFGQTPDGINVMVSMRYTPALMNLQYGDIVQCEALLQPKRAPRILRDGRTERLVPLASSPKLLPDNTQWEDAGAKNTVLKDANVKPHRLTEEDEFFSNWEKEEANGNTV